MKLWPVNILDNKPAIMYWPGIDDFQEIYYASITSYSNSITVEENDRYKAIKFVSNDYISGDKDNSIPLKAATCWFYMTKPGVLFDFGSRQFSFGVNKAGSTSQYWYLGYNSGNYGISSDVTSWMNQWVFCAINMATDVYFNMQRIGGTTDQASSTWTSFTIGYGETYNGGYYFGGYIQSLRFYGDYLTLDEIEEIYEKEKIIMKGLFKDVDNNYYKFDQTSKTLVLVDGLNTPTITSDDILTYGDVIADKIPKSLTQDKTLFVTSMLINQPTYMQLYNVSTPKLIVQNNDINLAGFNSIESIDVSVTGNGNIRFVISTDSGNTWKAWNGSEWVTIKDSTLDINNDVQLVLDNGMSPSLLGNLTSDNWNALYPDGLTKLRFAFAIEYASVNDNIRLSGLILNVAPKPYYTDETDNVDVLQGYSTIKITFTNTSGDFKINYVD